MKNRFKIIVFPLVIVLILFNSCQKDNSNTNTAGVIDGTWTVTSWSESGVAQPNVPSYQIALSFTNVSNNTGTMTFNSPTIPFNYTGNFSIDGNNLLTATLNETTGNMEINQWILSMTPNIGANNLTLTGTVLEKSPFWPDNTENVVFEATR